MQQEEIMCDRTRVINFSEWFVKNGISVSLEVMPTSDEEAVKLLNRIKKIDVFHPVLFCAITCHMRNNGLSFSNFTAAIELSKKIDVLKIHTLLHFAANGLSKENVLNTLLKFKEMNIQNIFALRGDIVSSDFPYALHLVQFIRFHFSNQYNICVAAYPNGHPDASSYKEDIQHLKEKVDAGANFIITQIVLDAQRLIKFAQDCKGNGIDVPILAGILPIQDYGSFHRIIKLCRLQVPNDIRHTLDSIQQNEETIKLFGIYQAVQTVKSILNSRCINGIHFFTLNRVTGLREILQETGFITLSPPKLMPNTQDDRKKEGGGLNHTARMHDFSSL